jgi:hypothetical protein
MFRHLCRPQGVSNLYYAKLRKFLILKLLKLQFRRIIRLEYYLVVAEWYSMKAVRLVAAYTICNKYGN